MWGTIQLGIDWEVQVLDASVSLKGGICLVVRAGLLSLLITHFVSPCLVSERSDGPTWVLVLSKI